MNLVFRTRILLTALALAVVFPTTATAQLVVRPERPVAGQPLTLMPSVGEVVDSDAMATFAPGTVVPRELVLQDASSEPGFQWTPDTPGLWQVSIGDASVTIVVGRERIPVQGLIVLLVAASSLIFLSAWGLGRKS